MKYTEQYPINNSPQGDTTKEAILKNRSEILSVVAAMGADSIPAGGLRNRVLHGSTAEGAFTFISSDGLSAAIDGSVVPVYITFAAGFDDKGGVDYLEKVNKKVSAWALPASNTSYLFVDRSTTGALTYDSTTIEPVYQPSAPTAVLNAHYFNTTEQKMYVYNGTEWSTVQRVFVAAVTTTSTSVTTITYMENKDASAIPSGGVSTIKLADNSVNDVKIGTRTVTADVVPTADAGNLTTLLSNMAACIKRITGEADWKTPPKTALNNVYPVGSIYLSIAATDPGTLFGGTWTAIEQGRMLISQGTNYLAGSTGGEATHTLSINEIPPHNHFTNTSNNGAHRHDGTTSLADLQGAFDGCCKTPSATGIASDGELLTKGPGDWTAGSYRVHINASHNHTFVTEPNGDHNHVIQLEGGGQSHNNLPPYLAVYMWTRTA